jgi:hypothetical protein
MAESTPGDDIKSIVITGNATTDLTVGGRRRRVIGTGVTRRRRGAATVIGGNNITVSKSNIPPAPVIPIDTTSIANIQPILKTVAAIAPVLGGSSSKQQESLPKIKIAPKRRTQRIILVKKQTHGSVHLPSSVKHRTQRKLSIPTQQFHARIKKANTTRKAAHTMSIDKIKSYLVSKKIIKPQSNAPESILRQMYADSLIVSQKSL